VSEICVLLVGQSRRREFRQARAAMETSARLIAVPDVPAAEEVLADGRQTIDLVVVAQSYPGEFSHEAVERLRRLAPLTRILGLLGSWCEGEARSGRPWPGVIRSYWHQWPARWQQELARLRLGRCPAWGLPITASEEDRLLLRAEEPITTGQGLVVLYARQPEVLEGLSAICRAAGYSTVGVQSLDAARVEGATVAIFDGTDGSDEELSCLAQFSQNLPRVPMIVLLNFPRVEDRDRVLAAGATAVLSKPLLLEDLCGELGRVGEMGREGTV
jgi:CheY-like chemotaxis protein